MTSFDYFCMSMAIYFVGVAIAGFWLWLINDDVDDDFGETCAYSWLVVFALIYFSLTGWLSKHGKS